MEFSCFCFGRGFVGWKGVSGVLITKRSEEGFGGYIRDMLSLGYFIILVWFLFIMVFSGTGLISKLI